jgi:hypothetical protein
MALMIGAQLDNVRLHAVAILLITQQPVISVEYNNYKGPGGQENRGKKRTLTLREIVPPEFGAISCNE